MDTRIIAYLILSFIVCSAGVGQTLTASDGEIDGLHPGYTYTLHPIPSGDSSVTPIIYWGYGIPMIFTLTAPPGSIYTIDLSLIANTDSSGGKVTWFLSDDALRWDERDLRLNPMVSQTIAIDSTGTATLYAGISLTIPSATRYQMAGALLRCRAIDTSGGDTLKADARVAVYFLGDEFPSNTDGEVKNLSRNRTYKLTPGSDHGLTITLANGAEHGTPGKLRVSAEAGSEILISTVLPNVFTSDDEGYPAGLPCTYGDSSFYVEETGQYVSPRRGGFILRAGPDGNLTVDIGLVLRIPADAQPGSYTCQMIFSATYTGNSSRPRIPMQSEAEVLFTAQVTGEDIPDHFSLLQNYPNPFNPYTTISYELPKPTHVLIKVYDLLGREISTLVDGFRIARINTERFDSQNLPSGVYFYRITTKEFSATRRMVIAR